MRWIIILAVCLGVVAGCSPVGPDPQFGGHSGRMEEYIQDQGRKLDHVCQEDLAKLYYAWRAGKISEEEYRIYSKEVLAKLRADKNALYEKFEER